MKVSGFTIVRNAVTFDYPIVEAIRSALPIVDEFIVNVGQSDDGTLDLIHSIGSDKIRVLESFWDDSMKKDGLLFSHETNKALARCTGDWALYLQADEVLHERDYPVLQTTLSEQLGNPSILGFTFRYLHFYGDYRSVNPWFYHRAVRVVRNDGRVESCGDAVGFWLKADRGYLQTNHKDRVRPSGATIYHYGWVKQGRTLLNKFRYQMARHHGDDLPPDQARLATRDSFEFPDYDVMKEFREPHPAVMTERVAAAGRLRPRANRWMNARFYRMMMQKGFRG